MEQKDKRNSNCPFRSGDLRVMSPARFRCAKLLDIYILVVNILSYITLLLKYKQIESTTVTAKYSTLNLDKCDVQQVHNTPNSQHLKRA